MNQSALHTSDAGVGTNGVGDGNVKLLPFADAAICCDICDKSYTVVSPESGLSVLL